MAVIRLTHVADLPTPEDLVRQLRDAPPPAPGGGGGGTQAAPAGTSRTPRARTVTQGRGAQGSVTALAPASDTALAGFPGFEHVLDLIRAQRDAKLLIDVETGLRLAAYRPGRIEFTPTPDAPQDLAQRLGTALQRWTGQRWTVSLVNSATAPTIAEARDAAQGALEAEARAHPLVRAVLEAFPRATIRDIRTAEDMASEAGAEALPEVEEEWDPFEES
jgi:DNA polymerase-3 subunit gamma/tau